MPQPEAGGRLRLSLLWKLLLPSGLVFVIISGLMTVQSWSQLIEQLRVKTIEQLEGDQRVLVNLFTQLRSEYSHIGAELASAYDSGGQLGINQYIERSPDIFVRLNWVSVHAADRRALASWSPAGVQPSLSPQQEEILLAMALRDLRPVGQIACSIGCEYVLAMPAGARSSELVMAMAAPIVEVLPAYGALTGADVVLLRPSQPEEQRIVAHTLGNLLQPADLERFASLPVGASGDVQFQGRTFAYLFASLDASGEGQTSLRALLLRDMTERHTAARNQAAQQLGLDLLVILFGLLAIFWIMSRNMNRLRRVTSVLPMLSETEKFEETRNALREASPTSLAADEVDVLRNTLEWLSTRLEQLHGAEAASEAKSRFLATMSHEIRTPMSGILGLTEILGESELSNDQRRMASMIHESTLNLLSIINDVLDYSRLEAGAAELDLIEFSPASLLDSVADLVAISAKRKNLSLRLLYPPDLPGLVRGDQGKIRQVLLNLVSNAIKFTQRGHVTLRVGMAESRSDSAALVFSVEDSGIGIAPEVQQKIFHRFSQADSTTTRKFGGTGLGLAICEGLASLMGSQIQLNSQPGQGSRFSLSLALPVVAKAQSGDRPLFGYRVDLSGVPRVEQHCWDAHLLAAGAELGGCATHAGKSPCIAIGVVEGNGSQLECRRWVDGESETSTFLRPVKPSELVGLIQALSQAEGAAVSNGQHTAHWQFGLHVLVAEDQPVNRDLLGRQLEQLGCTAQLSENGREALRHLEEGGQFDLLISDLHMPELDGYELTERVRGSESAAIRELPVVVLTASASPQDLARLKQHGVNRKLVKPLRISELEDCLIDLGFEPRDAGSRTAAVRLPEGASADAAREETPVLDLNLLREVLGEDLEILGSYRGLFEENSRPLLDQCREAWQSADADLLAQLLHRIKGSSRSLGGLRLAETVAATEQAARAGEKDIDERLGAVEREFDALLAALDRQIQAA